MVKSFVGIRTRPARLTRWIWSVGGLCSEMSVKEWLMVEDTVVSPNVRVRFEEVKSVLFCRGGENLIVVVAVVFKSPRRCDGVKRK